MLGNVFTLVVHITGTLTAAVNFRWTAPFPCTILAVSAVGSNANNATFDLGTSADTDGFLAADAVGVSNTPNEYDRADFDGALVDGGGDEYPRLADGDILVLTVDHDGAAGTAVQNLSVVITALAG